MTTLPEPSGSDGGLLPPALSVTGLGHNTAWLYLNAGASVLGGLFLLGFSFRHLGASTYGVYALVATAFAVFGTVDFGLRLFVIRATARDSESFAHDERRRARRDVEAAHQTYVLCGLFVLAASGITMVLVAIRQGGPFGGAQVPLLVLLVGLSVALNLGTASFAGIPIGRRQFQVPAIGGLAGTGVKIAVVVTTIGHLKLVALGAGFLAGVLVSQGYCIWWVYRHEPWFRHIPRPVGWAEIRRVVSFAAPLLIISASGPAISATDLVVVGAVATTAAAGLYRAGSIVPSQATAMLFSGYDTIYPHLAGTTDLKGQENATRFLTRVAAFVAGSTFAIVIVLRVDVVMAVIGHPSALAQSVLVVFCCVWLANVPVHGLMLLLIARGRQGVFVWLVGVEAAANLALSIIFALVLGPIGPAYATLVALVASSLIVFPAIARHEFSKGIARKTLIEALAAIGVGGASAVLAISPLLWLGAGWGRLLIGGALGSGISCAVGLVLLRQHGRAILTSMLRGRTAAPTPR